MDGKGTMSRRQFVAASAAVGAVAALPGSVLGAPAIHSSGRVAPLVISDISGFRYRNQGPENSVERAFRGITEGDDVLDALVAGVNIPELDPEEAGIGYGGLPNAEGVVQLDSCCMHGPKKQAGGVAALEGVRTPSLVARAVMQNTDHHLLVGKGAQAFRPAAGVHHRRRSEYPWLPGALARVEAANRSRPLPGSRSAGAEWVTRWAVRWSGRGSYHADSFWGTTNSNGINADGEICGVTTTSGLAWKIPGRVGDSPILGAGLVRGRRGWGCRVDGTR